MPVLHLDIQAVPEPLREGMLELQRRLELPRAFPAEVVADAEAAAHRPSAGHEDLTAVEFVTIDPPTSRDLDQAIQIERHGDGYLVRYAISDVAHFVHDDTALGRETHRRGQTLYAPSARVPLHPAALSEGAASLLDDGLPRPALVWQHRLDGRGDLRDTSLTRALIVSRAKLSYDGVQADLDAAGHTPASRCCRKLGGCGKGWSESAAASRSTCRSKRSSNVTARGESSSAGWCQWSGTTHRSRCSPGSRPREP